MKFYNRRSGVDARPECDGATYADRVIRGKSFYAFGDSIVYGHSTPNEAFSNLIAEAYDMTLSKYAKNGASVICVDSSEKEDASEETSGNYIINQIKSAPLVAPDLILFNGGTNDAYGAAADDRVNSRGAHINLFEHIGQARGVSATEFDSSTFCGGFEEILYTLKTKYPDTPIVYVTTHKSGARDWTAQCKVRELALEMCEAWDVYVADVFGDSTLDTREADRMAKYIINGAGSHPNKEGCMRFYMPVIVRALTAAARALPTKLADTVDVAVFAGQSNMSGRGSAESATVCAAGAGFEYKSVSEPGKLLPIAEPFGLGEDVAGAISDIASDGASKRTGSMVSAFVDEYNAQTGRQLIGVSASIGGSSSSEWRSSYINDAAERLEATMQFLVRNGVNIGNCFVVWSQGESDADNNVSDDVYIANTREIFAKFKALGADKCYLIETGHYNYVTYPNARDGFTGKEWDERYGRIRAAQRRLCAEDDDFESVAGFEPHLSEMKDMYHYNQSAYNAVGMTAAANVAADIMKQR